MTRNATTAGWPRVQDETPGRKEPVSMSKEWEGLAQATLLAGGQIGRQDADTGALAELADRADAYVATTIEALCRIELALPAQGRSGRQVAHLAEIKRRLEALEDLVTCLRDLAAQR